MRKVLVLAVATVLGAGMVDEGRAHAETENGLPTVHVVLTSDRDHTELGQLVGAANVVMAGRGGMVYGHVEEYKLICRAPCEADLDPQADYKIGGGVTPTGTFAIPRTSAPLRLTVKGGSPGKRFGGFISTVFGASAFLAGGIMTGVAFAAPGLDGNGNVASFDTGMLVSGIATGVIGAALIGLGIPLIISSSTHVTSDNGQEIAHGPTFGLRGISF